MYVCVFMSLCSFFFFKQKTAYEMLLCDWSSDVCSSDLTQRKERHDDHIEQQLYAKLRLGAKRQLEVARGGPGDTAPGASRRQLASGGGSLRRGRHCKRSDWTAAA